MKLAALLDPMAEAVWLAACAATGSAVRMRVRAAIPFGGQSILVIAPHPDDETFGCAGTILQHVRHGDAVCLAFITDGSKSRAGGLLPDEMRKRRHQEAEAASGSLQVSHFQWFGLTEGGWNFEQLRDPMLHLLQQISPDVIYAPSRVDFHPEHHWVAHSLARLLREAGKLMASAAIRVYQLQVPLTSVLSNRIVDCSDVCEAVAAAMSAYTTQSVNISRALRMRRYSAKSYGFKEQGEEFWQMSVSSYCRLHADTPDGWDVACFRGMRHRSFSDPLAFGLGLKERRRLAREAAALDDKKREG